MSVSFPIGDGPAYPARPPLVNPTVHEVWVNPGWPDEQRVYKGDDANAAARGYAAADQTLAPGQYLIWTVDGRKHMDDRRAP